MTGENNRSRRKFLGKALGAVAFAALNPLSVFLKPKDVLAAGNGFIIDLNSQTYSHLNAVGGSYRIKVPNTKEVFDNGDVFPYSFIVTRTTPSAFSVVSGRCTHEHYELDHYNVETDLIKCLNPNLGHTSTYSVDGIVLHGPWETNLTRYDYTYHPPNNTLEVFIPGLAVKNGEVIISSLELYQNFPNPVTAVTSIRFKSLYYTKITLTVTDALGHVIAILHDGGLEAGDHSFNFDASIFPSGMYFYHLSGGGQKLTKQMEVIK